jgi:hypothetical protein
MRRTEMHMLQIMHMTIDIQRYAMALQNRIKLRDQIGPTGDQGLRPV